MDIPVPLHPCCNDSVTFLNLTDQTQYAHGIFSSRRGAMMSQSMKTKTRYQRLALAVIASIASLALSTLPTQDALAQGSGKGKGNSGQQHGKGSPGGAKQGGYPSSGTQAGGNQTGGHQSSGHPLGASQSNNAAGTLSPSQSSQLTRMMEEEKLAHDVYLALAKSSGLQIFTTIAKAESQHMRAVEQLATRYALASGSKNLSTGSFSNPQFQSLYQTLVTSGNASPLEAVRVGAKVEEMDILDLQKFLAENPPQEVAQVLKHLQLASMNHLRAFTTAVKEQGGTYTPQFMNQREFNDIIASDNQRGNGQGMGGMTDAGNRPGGKSSDKNAPPNAQQSKKGPGKGNGKRGPDL
jgi:hypothetical protein